MAQSAEATPQWTMASTADAILSHSAETISEEEQVSLGNVNTRKIPDKPWRSIMFVCASFFIAERTGT
jgi:hypothetical protein